MGMLPKDIQIIPGVAKVSNHSKGYLQRRLSLKGTPGLYPSDSQSFVSIKAKAKERESNITELMKKRFSP